MRRLGGLWAVVAMLLVAPATASASGLPDPGFGTGGTSEPTSGDARARAVAADGSTYLQLVDASPAAPLPGDVVAIARLRPDGTRDLEWGDAGRALVDLGPRPTDDAVLVDAFVVEPTGALLVLSASAAKGSSDIRTTVTRLTSTGAVDRSFGVDGTATLPGIGAEGFAYPGGLVRFADGSLVVTWTDRRTRDETAHATRFTADGTLDRAYGTQGTAALPTPTGDASLSVDPLAAPGGRLVVSTFDGFVALDRAGRVDPTFGDGGVLAVDGGAGAFSYDRAAQLPDGRLRQLVTRADGTPTLAAFTPGGHVDASYGDGGTAVVTGTSAAEAVPAGYEHVELQPSGAALVAFYYHPPLEPTAFREGLMRLTPSGRPDPGFGTGGVVLLTGQEPTDPWQLVDLLPYDESHHRVLLGLDHVDQDHPEEDRWSVRALVGDEPPTADVSLLERDVRVGVPAAFDGSASHDPDAEDPIAYAWDLDGDGDYDDATGATASATFPTPGRIDIGLRVRDAEGLEDVERDAVEVGPESAQTPTSTSTTPTSTSTTPSSTSTTATTAGTPPPTTSTSTGPIAPATTSGTLPVLPPPGVPSAVPATAPAPARAATTVPRPTLATTKLVLDQRGRVALRLRCPAGTTRCSGRATLRVGTRASRSAGYAVAPGRTATVRVALARLQRSRALARKAKLAVVLAPTGGTAGRTAVTLRRASR